MRIEIDLGKGSKVVNNTIASVIITWPIIL